MNHSFHEHVDAHADVCASTARSRHHIPLRLCAVAAVSLVVLLTGCDRLREKFGGTKPSTPSVVTQENVFAALSALAATGAVMRIESPGQFAQYALTNNLPVAILFHSPESAPAAKMMSVVAEVAAACDRKLLVMSVDLSQRDLKPIEAQYVIKEIPTIVCLQNGREVFRLAGSVPFDMLEPQIERSVLTSVQP